MHFLQGSQLSTYVDLRHQVDQQLAESTPETHQSFFQEFLISNEQRRQFVDQTMSAFAESSADTLPKRPSLPYIIHRLWLTDTSQPISPRDYYLERIARQIKRLGDKYHYVFWHNCDAIPSALAPHLSDTNIEFRNINSLSSDPMLMVRIDNGIDTRKYVLASDICKYMIINECGGIYADIGIDFDHRLLNLIHCNDVSLFIDNNLFFQPAFMAAPAKHPAFQTRCDLLVQPEILSAIGLRDCKYLDPGHEIWIHGGLGFTAALILLYDKSFNILAIPPNRGLLHCESEGSWYRPGNKFGNALIQETAVSHLQWQIHQDHVRGNKKLSDALAGWDPVELLRLKVTRHLNGRYWLK